MWTPPSPAKKHGLRALALIAMLCLSACCRAEDFFGFSDTSVSLLTGWGYALPGDHLSALTLENSNDWLGGDFYGFLDATLQHDHPAHRHRWYFEASPRFSLAKLAGLDFGDGMLRDVLVATTWERGENGNESWLLGAGVTLALPGFSFFKANLYARNDRSLGAGFDDLQITVNWSFPFKISRYKFLTNGFSDYVFGYGPRARNFHFSPQIRVDVGDLRGRPGKYYLGLEFDYWDNQYGIADSPALDTSQLGVSLMFRAHL